jgi:hypothetical protein
MAVAIGLLVWALPNVVVYTTGQFMGWTHGRFEPQKQGPPVAETPLAKLGVGIATGMLTAIGGIVWSLLWMTVAIWLPGYVRRRRQR